MDRMLVPLNFVYIFDSNYGNQRTYIEASYDVLRVWYREMLIVLQGAIIWGVLVLILQVDQDLHQVR
jgi:hypothetical protein